MAHTWKSTFTAMVVVGLLGVVGCIAAVFLAGGGIFAIFAVTKPMIEASEQFLTLVGQEKLKEAYASTADGFRARQTEAAFAESAKKLELTDFASVSWTNRQFNNNDGSAEGNVTTKKQATKPIAIKLVHAAGQWKVVSVRYDGVDLAEVAVAPPPVAAAVPEVGAMRDLIVNALLDFNVAVKANDFNAFHGKLSATFKKQITPAELTKAFDEFVTKKIDIGGIKDVEPEFVVPLALDENGLLVLDGHFPTQPVRVHFAMKFQNDPDGWKLFHINVRTAK